MIANKYSVTIRFMNARKGSSSGRRKIFGFPQNVVWMGVVSFLNDLSSDMIFPFIPIFLTSVLGASLTFVGLIEGIADATASILKVASGWLSDRWQKRKSLTVLGYSLSAISKPFLAAATMPWHALGVRFLDRVGKGTREAPRDALISFSVDRAELGRAFGFHRAMDTLGAALGPLIAFAVLPFINQNYRVLFLLSFVASVGAVLIIIFFVREVAANGQEVTPSNFQNTATIQDDPGNAARTRSTAKNIFVNLGAPFFLFLIVATIASLGKASEAFLILRARELGIAIVLIPILYFAYNIVSASLATPFGMLADRIGKRNMFVIGLFLFAGTYVGFAFATRWAMVWIFFIMYGMYVALTDGVGRAVVAGLVGPNVRATAFGIYNACTGIALLPASVFFGYISQHFGSKTAFLYGAGIAIIAGLLFLFLRKLFSSSRAHSTT